MRLTELMDLLLPSSCGGCGSAGSLWCAGCADSVGPPRGMPGRHGMPALLAAGGYTGPLRTALLQYKERGRPELAGPLAGLLAGALLGAVPDVVSPEGTWWLVPVPSRPAAARARGGDHVLLLARTLSRRLAAAGRGCRVLPVLRMGRAARDSVGLDAAARAANLEGRIRLARGGPAPDGRGGHGGRSVLLLDDVLTTGATVRTCSSALVAAGLPVRLAVVLCASRGPLAG